jgi:hypothetical protein
MSADGFHNIRLPSSGENKKNKEKFLIGSTVSTKTLSSSENPSSLSLSHLLIAGRGPALW